MSQYAELREKLLALNPWKDMDWPETVRQAANALSLIEAERDKLREALADACDQILASYRTWVADDGDAHPRPGQIPRYDRARAALHPTDNDRGARTPAGDAETSKGTEE